MAAASGWYAIADALADGLSVGNGPDYTMNWPGFYLMISMFIIVVATMLLQQFVIPKRWHFLFPAWSMFCLSFLLPPQYGCAQALGQVIHYAWKWARPEACKAYTYSIAAGLISGGCISSLLTAVFAVVGIDNLYWGM